MVAENAGSTQHPRNLGPELKKISKVCHTPPSLVSKVVGGQTMSKLKTKTALVTGASKGIGAGIALELASEDSGWLTGEIIHATGGL